MYEATLAVARRRRRRITPLRAAFDELGEGSLLSTMSFFQSEIADGLRRAGKVADGLTVVKLAIERCERSEERWLFAQLLPVRGEPLLPGEKSATAKAEDSFREALDWANRQGALCLELRAATSLARLLRDQRRCAEAIAVI